MTSQLAKAKKSIVFILATLITIACLGSNLFAHSAGLIAENHIVGSAVPSAETLVNGFTVGLAADDGTDYVEPTNTYHNGSPRFYFVTGDPVYATAHGQLITIMRDSGTYDATIIYSARTSFNAATHGLNLSDVSPLPTAYFSRIPGAPAARANATFFFDAGRFIDIDHFDTNNLSGNNTSLVGLYQDATTGEPATVFHKLPIPPTEGALGNLLTRWRFDTPNNYIENIIFDGSGINMSSPNGWGSGNDRGSYFWVVGIGSSNFVARDVILQNIGSQNTSISQGGIFAGANGNQRNTALNILRAMEGQRNFENLTIRRAMTTGGYGVVQLNNTSSNYFRNLNVINPNAAGTGTAQNANAHPIKIEHNVSQDQIDMWLGGSVRNQRDIVFDGVLLVPSRGTVSDDVYIQDYRYQNILVPSNFAWSLLRTSNGSGITAAIRVYNRKQSAIALYAPLQLDTGYWFVEAAGGTPNFQTQLNNINAAIGAARAHTTVPAPNIKMVAGSAGQLGAFTIPNFPAAYQNYLVYTTNIVALIQTATPNLSLYPALAHASGGGNDEFVPYVGGEGGILLHLANSDRVLLFNFDFKTVAAWTIEDAEDGGIVNFTRANSGRNLFVRYFSFYDVTYVFESATAGSALPATIAALLPPAVTGLPDGATQTSPAVTPATVDAAGGRWTFLGWDKATVTINGADETVTGRWAFTAVTIQPSTRLPAQPPARLPSSPTVPESEGSGTDNPPMGGDSYCLQDYI